MYYVDLILKMLTAQLIGTILKTTDSSYQMLKLIEFIFVASKSGHGGAAQISHHLKKLFDHKDIVA